MKTRCCILLMLLLSVPLLSHVPRRLATPSGIAFEKWADSSLPITWRMNPSGGANITGSRGLLETVRSAFSSWSVVPTAAVSFTEGAATTVSEAALDGANVIAVSPVALSGGVASVTVLYSYSATGNDPIGRAIVFPGQILEADILLNPNVAFSTEPNTAIGRVHLESRLRHEIGHLLGLDHSGLLSAVMFPGLEAEVIRPLTLDDEIGLSMLYPEPAFWLSRGTVRGVVKTSSGNPVFGAHVVIANEQGTPLASVVTGANGEYHVAGLPPSNYHAFAEPLDRPLQPAELETLGSLSPGETVNANFTSRFAAGPAAESGNVTLTKTAGDNQTGVAGQPLASLLEVEVRGTNNSVKAGVTVMFRSTSGGGIVVPIEAVTDVQGKARTKAYLGAGQSQTFMAVASNAVVSFSASVQPPAISSINFIDESTSSLTREIVVVEGGNTPARLRIFDSLGRQRTDVAASYSSSNADVATIDSSGVIQGLKAGFSTLTATASGVVATATISVVQINTATGDMEISAVAQDLSRRLYLAASSNHTILVADSIGQTPVTYAGIHQSPGLVNAARLQSQFKSPAFLALNQADGSLYVSDGANHVIRRIQPGPGGVVETFAGTGSPGSQDGAAAGATFNTPQGIALDNTGNLWIADSGNHAIRRINLVTRIVETIAGKPGVPGNADGTRDQAAFSSPVGIAFETESVSQQFERFAAGGAPAGTRVVVADTGNGLIRRVAADGRVETIAQPGAGAALLADSKPDVFAVQGIPLTFASPTGIAVDPFGNIYLSEPNTGDIKVILANGSIVRAAPANAFVRPKGLAVESSGRIVVAAGNSAAREIVYGQPEVSSITPSSVSNKGGVQVTVKGRNFAPGTGVVVAGFVIQNVDVRDTETAVFITPALPSGRTTLTVFNRAGLGQAPLLIAPTPLNELPGGYITTISGGSTFAGDGSRASDAFFDTPSGLALDSSANLYIADRGNFRIRRIDPKTGVVTSIAGSGREGSPSLNGMATTSALKFPEAVVVDSRGNIYFSGSGESGIYKVDRTTGIMTRPVFGSGVSYLAIDAEDNLYYPDFLGRKVLKLAPGSASPVTFAGGGSDTALGDGGPATQASIIEPQGIAIDRFGNVYIAERSRFRIRKVNKDGIISTVVGNVSCCPDGDGGPATAASVREPEAITVDAEGNLYIADQRDGVVHRIRKVDATSGIITTLVSFPTDLNPGLIGINYEFRKYMAADASGALYVSITFGHQIARINTKTGAMTIVAGRGTPFTGDGLLASEAGWVSPHGISFDRKGDLFVTDREANTVRRIDGISGKIGTVAGTGKFGYPTDRQAASQAAFGFPEAVAADVFGNVYVRASSDYISVGPGQLRERIARIDAQSGLVSFILVPTGASLGANPAGELYIGTRFDGLVRKYDPATGSLAVIAGGGTGTGDNLPAGEVKLDPTSLAFDAAGNVFVTASFDRVRKLNASTSTVTIAAGNGVNEFSKDNVPATQSSLFIADGAPNTVAVDKDGNLYILEVFALRRVDAQTGMITTVARLLPGRTFKDNVPAEDGGLEAAAGIAVDADGNIFVTDSTNKRIRAIRRPGSAAGSGLPAFMQPTLSSVQPTSVVAGAGTTVTLSGANFVPGKTAVNVDTPEVGVDDITVVNGGSMTARLTAAATAAAGQRTLTVTTPGGTSAGVNIGVAAPAQSPCTPLTFNTTVNGNIAITDAPSRLRGRFADCFTFSGTAGDRIVITMNSQDLDSYLILLDNAGQVIASDDQNGGVNNARIPAGGNYLLSSTGSFTIEATTFGSPHVGAYTLGLSLVPGLTSISPSSAMAGSSSVTVTLTGARFVEGATNVFVSGGGITVSGVTVTSPTSLTAGLAIASSAATGGRSVTVSTAAGTSAAVTFTVNPVLFPQATVQGLISLPGSQPTALAVYEGANKLFVADDNSGNVFVIDGLTHATQGTINVGSAVFDIVVNETYGKVYAASSKASTTGITSGSGLISVINANSNALITQINPGHQGAVSYFLLANDEVQDKIYVAFFSGVGVIDVATDQFTLIAAAPYPYPFLSKIGINTKTNEIFLAHYADNKLVVINGNTLAVQLVDFPAGASKPLDIAVNEAQNKVYITMITIPGQATMGICIYDRSTNQFKFVGSDDLEPLAFNPVANRLYAGVQVGSKGAIVEGATDSFRPVDLGGAGIGASAIRKSTDNAYHVNQGSIFVVNGSITGVQKLSGNTTPRGGVIVSSIVISQATGLVYVVNDDVAAKVTVLQDVVSPQ